MTIFQSRTIVTSAIAAVLISTFQAAGAHLVATSLGGRVTVLPIDLTHEEINNLLGAHGDYTSEVESFMRSLGLP